MSTMTHRGRRWFSDHVVLIYAILVLLYMFTPVFVVILMSFNEPAARQTYQFDAFTWNNWTNICAPFQLCDSVAVSLKVGLLATLVATLLGTLMAFAMVRHRFRGRSAANTSWNLAGSIANSVAVSVPVPVGYWSGTRAVNTTLSREPSSRANRVSPSSGIKPAT